MCYLYSITKSNRIIVLQYKRQTLLYSFSVLLLLGIFVSCSTNKNTPLSRAYHSVNTRYNVYFNAHESYKEALRSKIASQEDNLSEQLHIYPLDLDAGARLVSERDSIVLTRKEDTNKKKKKGILSSTVSSLLGGGGTIDPNSWREEDEMSFGGGGSFTTTVDKCTKAIKTHSIKTKPRRDRARTKNAKYQAWIQQKEFNPFMRNVWLLLGRAEVQNGNYIQAISTFMYTTKVYSSDPDIVAECYIWIARAYTEMGWMYEAANVFYKLKHEIKIPQSLEGLYASVYANYLLRNKENKDAIVYVEQAIKVEKDKIQKLRLKYLLGQLYEKQGDKANAYSAYGSVRGLSTPHKFELYAQLNQLTLDERRPFAERMKRLTKLARETKNKDYQDKIYTTVGNAYMQKFDTINAVKNYQLAVDSGRSGNYDKALAQIRLGHIYFAQKEYILAQPCYSEALSALKKADKDYDVVSLRSEVLDELVIHVKTVKEQDSLQYIAQLPETERMQLINDKIKKLKEEELLRQKEEKQQKEQEDRQQRIETWDDLNSGNLFNDIGSQKKTTPVVGLQSNQTSTFYFYNSQTLEQGKLAFQKQWGTRKLEDNWRRRNKSMNTFGVFNEIEGEGILESDSLSVETHDEEKGIPEGKAGEFEKDIYNPQYYLQQLPFTVEAIEKSNELIENALFNMGLIYQYKLEDFNLAIDAYNVDVRRFPATPNLEEIYYQLFLIYMQLNDKEKTAYYRNLLIEKFPEGKYAESLSDSNYEWNYRHMHSLVDDLYEDTYNAYLDSEVNLVRANYTELKRKYPFSDLMPKFMLLNALTYAQTRDAANLKKYLEELVKTYPKADVSEMANDILTRIKDGRVLMSDGTPIRGMRIDMSLEDGTGEQKVLAFKDSIDDAHMMLLFFKANTLDRNELLYQVADYNFSNYMIQTFDLSFDQDPPLEMLEVKGFKNFANIRSYIRRAFGEEGLAHKIDASVLMVPVSVENSKILLRLGLDEYIDFYTEHYADLTPEIISYWKGGRPIITDFSDIEKLEDDLVSKEIEDLGIVAEPVIVDEGPVAKKEDVVKGSNIEVKQEREGEKSNKNEHTTTIKASDVFNESQLDLIKDVGEVLENPVDGIKGLFQKYKDRKNMTKEEKEELKLQRQQEKMRQRELKAIEKAKNDSIAKIMKAEQDSIAAIEKAKIAEEKRIVEEKARIEREKIETQKAKLKAREDARRAKEQERRDKKREQDERRKMQEKERDNRRKEQMREREEKRKQLEKERKQKEAEARSKRVK